LVIVPVKALAHPEGSKDGFVSISEDKAPLWPIYFQFASGVPRGKAPVPDELTPVLKITGSVLQVTLGCAQTGVDAAASKQKPARVLNASWRKSMRCEALEPANFLKIL
jgi:hypothetical protein